MVGVCCWERKFDWGEGGGCGAGDLGDLGRLVFLRGAVGSNVAWLVTGKINGDRLGGSRSGDICVRFQE